MDRLLVRMPNWLGDAVMASGVVARAVRGAACRPVIAMRPWLAPLAEAWGEGFDLDTGGAEAEARFPLVPRAALPFRVDRALVLTDSWRSLAAARAAGARTVYCFAGGGHSVMPGLRPVPRPRGPLTDQYGALADAAALVDAEPRFAVPTSWRTAAAALLDGRPSGPLVLVAPGASFGNAKRWPVDAFAALAASLRREGVVVSVVGTEADKAAAAAICRSGDPGIVSWAGRTDLPSLGGVCAAAAAVVGNDSGIVHLAAACGTATVGLYGSTAPEWTAPFSPLHRSLSAGLTCAPCFQRRCAFGAPCLGSIAPEDVASTVRGLLAAL